MKEQQQQQREKKGKKKGASHWFEFCKVCNLNHSQGEATSTSCLTPEPSPPSFCASAPSSPTSSSSSRTPSPLRPEHASVNRLWCVFCDTLIEEIQSSFTCANAINHLASKEHSNSISDFVRKYGGGMDRVGLFCISEANFVKWEAHCGLLNGALSSSEGSFGAFSGPPKDIRHELSSVYMDTLGKNINSFKSCVSNGVLPLQFQINERNQVFYPDSNKVTNVSHASYALSPHLVCTSTSSDSQGMQEATKRLKVCVESYPILNEDGGQGSAACPSSN